MDSSYFSKYLFYWGCTTIAANGLLVHKAGPEIARTSQKMAGGRRVG